MSICDIMEAGTIGQGTQSIAIGYQAGEYPTIQIGTTVEAINSGLYRIPISKKLQYIVKFRKPINVIDLFGCICSATKRRDVLMLLNNLWFQNNGFDTTINYIDAERTMADTLIFTNIYITNAGYVWVDNNHTELFDIVQEVAELKRDIAKDDLVAAHLWRINVRKIGLLDTIMEAVRTFAGEYIDEDTAKEAMAPANVAAMLAAASDSDSDTDMLDKLEAFAAECDHKLSPIVSCEWVLQ